MTKQQFFQSWLLRRCAERGFNTYTELDEAEKVWNLIEARVAPVTEETPVKIDEPEQDI